MDQTIEGEYLQDGWIYQETVKMVEPGKMQSLLPQAIVLSL
jgi:hypothetical protein